MFTAKDYNYIKLNLPQDSMTVDEYNELSNNLQEEYGLTDEEAFLVIEGNDDAVERIIEKHSMYLD